MNDLLFEVPESKSPRLLWVEKNSIKTAVMPEAEADEIGEIPGRWGAMIGVGALKEAGFIGYGNTEEDAILDLAIKLKIPLWNEEDRDPLRPCAKCGETIGHGANQLECEVCGGDCCTACSNDAAGTPDNPFQIHCDDCFEEEEEAAS